MAILVAFYLLLACIASSQLLPSRGYLWRVDTLPTARGGAISLGKDCSLSRAVRCPTTHITNHKTTCFLRPHCPRKHIHYKLSSLMSNVAFLGPFACQRHGKAWDRAKIWTVYHHIGYQLQYCERWSALQRQACFPLQAPRHSNSCPSWSVSSLYWGAPSHQDTVECRSEVC
jgi:hypothetical protein